jgi:hypothetical protein
MDQFPFRFFVGIDWASEEHMASVLDSTRVEIDKRKYPHSGSGLSQLADQLTKLSGGAPATVAIGIETPHGAVVEALIERGFAVFSLNPKQMDRFRDRHSVSGAKDDSRDAYVIADALATGECQLICVNCLSLVDCHGYGRCRMPAEAGGRSGATSPGAGWHPARLKLPGWPVAARGRSSQIAASPPANPARISTASRHSAAPNTTA